MPKLVCSTILGLFFLAARVHSLLLELQGDSDYCLTDLETDHKDHQGELKLKFSSIDNNIRILNSRRSAGLNVTLYSAPTSSELDADKKMESQTEHRFSRSLAVGALSHRFEANRTYSVCFKSEMKVGVTTLHLQFDYEQEIGLSSPGKIGESLMSIERLFSAVQEVEAGIMEQFEENSLYEKVYDEIEGRVTTCFTIKTVALIVVALVQGTIFFSLIEKHMGGVGGTVMPI